MKITPFTEPPLQPSSHPNPHSHRRTPRRVRATREKDRRRGRSHAIGQTPLPATVSATSERTSFLPEPGLLRSRANPISQPPQVLPPSQLLDVNNLIELIAARIDRPVPSAGPSWDSQSASPPAYPPSESTNFLHSANASGPGLQHVQTRWTDSDTDAQTRRQSEV